MESISKGFSCQALYSFSFEVSFARNGRRKAKGKDVRTYSRPASLDVTSTKVGFHGPLQSALMNLLTIPRSHLLVSQVELLWNGFIQRSAVKLLAVFSPYFHLANISTSDLVDGVIWSDERPFCDGMLQNNECYVIVYSKHSTHYQLYLLFQVNRGFGRSKNSQRTLETALFAEICIPKHRLWTRLAGVCNSTNRFT